MRASKWAILCSLRTFTRHHHTRPFAAGNWSSRYRRRHFHSAIARFASIHNQAEDPKVNADENGQPHPLQPEHPEVRGSHVPNDGSSNDPSNGSNNGSGSKPKDPSNYGSASNRARRHRSPKELPPVSIPDWFIETNIALSEDVDAILETVDLNPPPSTDNEGAPNEYEYSAEAMEMMKDHEKVRRPITSTVSTDTAPPKDDPSATNPTAPGDVAHDEPASQRLVLRKFPLNQSLSWALAIPEAVAREILMTLKAMMILPPPRYADNALENKAHMVLHCPKNGASRFLMQFMQEWSFSSGKFDYMRLDAQDIAEIGGKYMEDPKDFEPGTLSSLGYDVSSPAARGQEQGSEQPGEDEDFDEANEEDLRGGDNAPSNSNPFTRSSNQRKSADVGVGIISVGNLVGDFREAFKAITNNKFLKPPTTPSSNPYITQAPQELKDNVEDLKMGLLVETLLNAPERKIKARGYTLPSTRLPPNALRPELEADEPVLPQSRDNVRPISKDFIVFIEDYFQINATPQGSKFLDKLHEAVDVKRSEGKRVMVIGLSSSREVMPTLSKPSVDDMQAGQSYGQTRTIVVPVTEKTSEKALAQEHKQKVRRINERHLREMIHRLVPAPEQRGFAIDEWDMEIDSKTAFLVDLDDSVWSMDRVNRVAVNTLGSLVAVKRVELINLEDALTTVHESDQAKYKWIKEEERVIREKPRRRGSGGDERIRKLRQKCNKYEKRLLNGVIDADSIKTTFADIQAPQETVDALKTLTSLALARPDAFTYGVLATDRIPGLLLYGPPGTGKTLLAKAVAKESASTMLEVSGSDVYDMYVGESEKNVRAIFSLAKKLAPCVIFIDEADAILGSRSGSGTRTSHRDIINQFLREWDGMTESNAFIMVATNRPFDLDEASLRRLPRRLLVDLPVEKDREAIIKIHLKGETLDPDVSLSQLAKETPFYSGSDLKNVCVAAALACVREEFGAAAEHNNTIAKDAPAAEKYKYAEKRTLSRRHFVKGMDEISASISEDMSSLSAIRKFDEKYGDRKGRRKKLGGYGFRTVEESEAKGSDALRVRNQ